MIEKKSFDIGYGNIEKINIGKKKDLVFIGGPCAIENRDHALKMAELIYEICNKIGIKLIYKSCYDKDCRSSNKSFRGVGLEEGLKILSEVRNSFNIPVVSDFSDPSWAAPTAEVCDLIQIPAYLCRQTSILEAAAKTNKPILLKKGQFMSPWNMKNSVNKLENFGNNKIILTERGTFFGYNMLVNDMKSLPIMAETGYPTCYDATHSVQLPTSAGNISGGEREFIPFLVRSSIAIGIDALFMEVHDDPKNALSDPNTVLNIKYLDPILRQAKVLFETKLKLDNEFGDIKVD